MQYCGCDLDYALGIILRKGSREEVWIQNAFVLVVTCACTSKQAWAIFLPLLQ